MGDVGEPTGIPIDTLTAEEQKQIGYLDTETDEIFHLRHQVAKFYQSHRAYLGTIEDPQSGKERKTKLEDIYQASLQGQGVEQFINWDKVDADALVVISDLSPEEAGFAQEIYRDQVIAEFELARTDYESLRSKKGEWSETKEETGGGEEVRDYYRMRWGEMRDAVWTIESIEQQQKVIEQKLEKARSLMAQTSSPSLLRVINKYEAEIVSFGKTMQEIIDKDPHAYLYVRAKMLQEARNTYDRNGRIIETPYVKQKIGRIMSYVGDGRPVFLHGELGSGKTELLLHISRTRLSEKHIARWEAAHPRPSGEDGLEKWEAERDHQREPLLLAGHRGVEIDQMIGTRTIRRGEVPPPEAQVAAISEGWERYRQSMIDWAQQQPEYDDRNLSKFTEDLDTHYHQLYTDAYQELYKSPVVAEVVLGPLLQAMMEGRPYIEDETNAIPHHLQIVKNDLLNRRTGDWVQPPIPGARPFQVQDGYAYLCSGNYKPEDGVAYIGRQPMDAAYLSRFGIVNYDYLPMQHMMEAQGLTPEEQRTFRARNELYYMIIARLLDDDLTLTFPENGFQKLYHLSMVARNLQDIFSGFEASQAWFAEVNGAKVAPKETLKENVLSIRHMLAIVDAWKHDGFTKDIDYYVFLNYVDRSTARPEEMVYLYQMLQTQGDFFRTNNGWPASHEREAILKGELTISGQAMTVEQLMYGSDTQVDRGQVKMSSPIKTYPVRAVIEEVFGPAPLRERISGRYFDRSIVEEVEEPFEDMEEQRERIKMAEQIRNLGQHLEENGFPLSAPPKS